MPPCVLRTGVVGSTILLVLMVQLVLYWCCWFNSLTGVVGSTGVVLVLLVKQSSIFFRVVMR